MFWIFNWSFDILATVWATFPKIGRFFQSSGHSGVISRNKVLPGVIIQMPLCQVPFCL
jgi:hypothetical protein